MDDHFTNTADSVYLASLTQAKKILFLQKQLSNSELYAQNLQKDVQAMKLTINRLIKQRTNHEVLAKISQNMYRMQRRCRQMQQVLRQGNAKLLIQMQLRIQQRSQYNQKMRELQNQIEQIRKTNKDKQQQFTIVVNKLRKYQDIRQLMLDDKISKDGKKYLVSKDDDKEQIIKELTEQLNQYKKITKQTKKELDKKIQLLAFAFQNNVNFEHLRDDYLAIIRNQQKRYKIERKMYQNQTANEKNRVSSPTKEKKIKITDNLNDSTKELVKQIKKLALSNKMLQAALNQSIVKNQQLVLNNQILIDANLQLKQNLMQIRQRQASYIIRRKRSGTIRYKQQNYKQKIENVGKKNVKKAQTLNINTFRYSNTSQSHRNSVKQSQDDINIYNREYMDIEEMVKQRKLKQYLMTLKSKDYQVNIQQLYKDVNKMSQFLILSLGSRSKMTQNKDRVTYTDIIQRANNKKQKRSISVGLKTAEDTNQTKRNNINIFIPPLNLNQGSYGMPGQVFSGRSFQNNIKKQNEEASQEMKIDQY